jgi:hypothetical protein
MNTDATSLWTLWDDVLLDLGSEANGSFNDSPAIVGDVGVFNHAAGAYVNGVRRGSFDPFSSTYMSVAQPSHSPASQRLLENNICQDDLLMPDVDVSINDTIDQQDEFLTQSHSTALWCQEIPRQSTRLGLCRRNRKTTYHGGRDQDLHLPGRMIPGRPRAGGKLWRRSLPLPSFRRQCLKIGCLVTWPTHFQAQQQKRVWQILLDYRSAKLRGGSRGHARGSLQGSRWIKRAASPAKMSCPSSRSVSDKDHG